MAVTREEKMWEAMLNDAPERIPTAVTRKERMLQKLAKQACDNDTFSGGGGGNSGGGSDNLVVTVNTHFDDEEGTRITTYDADWDVIKQRFIEGKPTFVRWSNNYTTNSRQDIEFENVAPLSQVEFEDNSYATKGLVAFSINDSCNMRYVKLYSDGTALCSSLLLQRVQLPT